MHYVVIHKVTKEEDPGKGIVKYKPEDFYKIWTGVLMLIVPAPTFEKGEVIEVGIHEELLRNQGYYYRLWSVVAKKDITVKASGVVKPSEETYKITRNFRLNYI